MNRPSFHDNKKWGPWVFIPKPKAVQWPHETCIGFQILDNFSMHRGIQPKRWITGLHTLIGIFYFTLLPLGYV